MPFSRTPPPKGTRIRIFKPTWSGVNRRDRAPTRRLASKDRRAKPLPAKTAAARKRVEREVLLGRRKNLWRKVEERDLVPRKDTGMPTIQRKWLDETVQAVDKVIATHMRQTERDWLLSAIILQNHAPNKLLGKAFEARAPDGSRRTVFVGWNPITNEFFFNSSRRVSKDERRKGPLDRRAKTEWVYETE